MNKYSSEDLLFCAAELISNADAILVGAGSGIGVDSGLPDFRGRDGLWKTYQEVRCRNLSFMEIANPHMFTINPRLAWGFYGHRFNLYRSTQPHNGFAILKSWIDEKRLGGFAYTSNVDGHFQKAGFSEREIVECHGSINHWQCSIRCGEPIWDAPDHNLEIEKEKLILTSSVPLCPNCGEIARPNILMFADRNWDSERTDEQVALCLDWLCATNPSKTVVIEVGAGTAIPSVRNFCASKGHLIRINPASHGSHTTYHLKIGALAAISALDDILKG